MTAELSTRPATTFGHAFAPNASRGALPRWVLALPLIYGVISLLYMYSPAKRDVASGLGQLDGLGQFKVLLRLAALGLVGLSAIYLRTSPRFRVVARRLAPLILFGLWAVLSMTWSPTPVKSAGKALGVLAGALFAVCAGAVSSEEDRWHAAVRQTAYLCLGITVANLIAEFSVFGKVALYRYRFRSDVARDGVLMHAGGIAQCAGVALYSIVGCAALFRARWATRLLLFATPLCAFALYITNSRSAIAATGLACAGTLVYALGLRKALAVGLVPAALMCAVLVQNPSNGAVDQFGQRVQSYVLRGQTLSEMKSLSGRDEKWEMAWAGFEEAVFLGGGYDVVEGYQNVFINGRWQPLPVHSLYLFILTGTGMIGFTLFAWGLTCVLLPLGLRVLTGHPRARESIFVAAGTCMFLVIGYTEILFVDGRGMIGMVAYLWVGLAGAEALHGSTAIRPVRREGAPAC